MRRRRRAARLGWLWIGLALVVGCRASEPPRPLVVAPPPPPLPPQVSYELPPYIPWGEHTVETRLDQFGRAARARWEPWFAEAGLRYPAPVAVLVGLKREQRLLVYAGPSGDRLDFVRAIDWTATSGGPGPKLREGDRQIPEGFYRIKAFNPNSRYHVSLRVDYPNPDDRFWAQREGRKRPGGDIMIHGGDRSIGCIAVGDEAAEDLFVLAADLGLDNIALLIAPHDFRYGGPLRARPGEPRWVRDLYARLESTLARLPPPVVLTAGRREHLTPP